jgi:hypothetical protein
MRVIANTETAARNMLAEKVEQGVMTAADSERLFNWGFRIVLQTIGNWRLRNATDEAIANAILRRKRAAKLHFVQANTQNKRNLGAREMILAQMFEVVWQGMQQDAARYQNAR